MIFPQPGIDKLRELLSKPQSIVIVSHRNPDGDALGSSSGWKFFLEKEGHEASYISPNAPSANLKWIEGTDEVMVYDSSMGKKLCDAKIKSATVIFCLDFNAISRLEDLGEAIKSAPAFKVLVDHHQQPEDFADLTFSDTTYCATAQMIYDLISDLGKTDQIDTRIAETLYAGIATDSGFFQFTNATPEVYQVAGALVAKGARPYYVSEKVYNVFRESRLRFFGYCLNEKLKLVKNGQVAYMIATQAEIKKFNLQSGDSDGLVNYPFKIEGVQVCAYFSEEPNKIKISFRSRGDIDVSAFSRNNFEGGGHRNAAGGMSKQSVEATEKKFLEALDSLNLPNN